MTVLINASQRRYPMPSTKPDSRFSADLVNAVADVIRHHGYPLIDDGPDLDALAVMLHGFLYRHPIGS
jgi:hypothetical protein